MKATSRLSRSNLATSTGHLRRFASASAAQFRAAVQRVGSLAGLDLNVLANDLEALRLAEPLNGGLLGLKP
jgi:hypothetical protein